MPPSRPVPPVHRGEPVSVVHLDLAPRQSGAAATATVIAGDGGLFVTLFKDGSTDQPHIPPSWMRYLRQNVAYERQLQGDPCCDPFALGNMLSTSELTEHERSRRSRRRWRSWRFDLDALVLVFEPDDPFNAEYVIDLTRLNHCAPMLDAMAQVRAKAWATPAIVGLLFGALDDLFRFQSRLCGSGRDKVIPDVAAYLRSVYGPMEPRRMADAA